MSITDQFLTLFGGATAIHYRVFADRKFFDMISGPLTDSVVAKHLSGEARYGVFSFSQTNNRASVITLTTQHKGNREYARDLIIRLLDTLETIEPVIYWNGDTGYTAFLFLDTPLLKANANDIAGYLQHRTSHNLTYTPGDGQLLNDWFILPLGKHPASDQFGKFVDPKQGFEQGPHLDPETVLSQRVSTQALLKLKESTLPPMSTAEAAAAQFGDRSVFPLLIEYVKRFPDKASQPRPLEDIMDDLRLIASETGRPFIWYTTNSLGRHMASKRLRTALQQTLGLLIGKEQNTVYGYQRNTYAFKGGSYS